ncbi:MAG: B12-binding domain-containing radical SAM protein, partial [Candidatus Omnitrophica bacterium]|nr:B12-binding domain-containing radical SAM protein [Candidatus Omnitrophota bacterium]
RVVVIGGPHVSALPEESLRDTGADYAVCGEGESSFVELIGYIMRGDPWEGIPGVYKAGDHRRVQRRPFIENLDDLPFPDWEAMDPRRYRHAPHGGLIKQFPVAPVVSSRGCPYECTFCASPRIWERKIRFRSPENTVDEISYLVKQFGVREIHFEDDNLTMKKEYVLRLCRMLLERKLKVSWATPNGVRADTLDREMLRLMKRSGCYYLAFGIESANAGILKRIRKRASLDTISRAISLARREGIMTQGFFIFGLPGETPETIRESMAFARSSGLDRAQFLILDVLPGSALWDELKDQRRLPLCEARSFQQVTWLPEGIDEQTLLAAQSRAFREFFLRPRQLLGLVKYLKLSQLSFVARRMHDYRVRVPFIQTAIKQTHKG